MIRVVLGGRSYSRHTCLTPDVGWRESPASTGRNVVSVGLMHPVIIRIVSFSATSSFLVWVLRHQAGDTYSAALYTRASAPVRSVDVYAPRLEPAKQRRRPFLALNVTCVSCSRMTVARFFVGRCSITWILAFEIPSAFNCKSTSPRRVTTEVARPEKDACSGEGCGRLAVEVICLLERSSVPNKYYCQAVVRNLTYRFMIRLNESNHMFVRAILSSDLLYTSRIRRHWMRSLYIHFDNG